MTSSRGFAANRLLLIAIIIPIILSLAFAVQRFSVEQANRTVELVVDLDDFLALARFENEDPGDLLVRLREAGVTSAAVKELQLPRLSQEGTALVYTGRQLSGLVWTIGGGQTFLRELVSQGSIKPDFAYLITNRPESHQLIQDTLSRKLPTARVEAFIGPDVQVVGTSAPWARLERIGFGLSPEDVKLVTGAGLKVVPRLLNFPGASPAEVDRVLREAAVPGASSVIFMGEEALGYPAALDATARGLQNQGLTLGLVETANQLGFIQLKGQEELAASLDYRLARVFSLSRQAIDQAGPGESVVKWVRSVKDRNIRLLYLRPFWKAQGNEPLIGTNVTNFRRLAEELRGAGYSLGQVGSFREIWVFKRVAVPASWGVAIGGLLLLQALFPLKPRQLWALLGLAVVSVPLAYVAGPDGWLRTVFALGSALVFPSLAIVWQLARWNRISSARDGLSAANGLGPMLREGVRSAAAVALVSLAGALFVGTLLGDIRHLVEFEYFRGVKLALAFPLLATAAGYAIIFMPRSEESNWRSARDYVLKLMNRPLTFWHLAALAVVGAGVFLYLARSGNQPAIAPSELELRLRSFLDTWLLARPRNKEFLIGYPALILAAGLALRGYRAPIFPLALAGSMAANSIVNSFSHLRTPLLISLLRTAHGWWLGVLIGSLLILLLAWVLGPTKRRGRSPAA